MPHADVFDPAQLHRAGTVLLDTARPDAENQHTRLFTDPLDVCNAPTYAEVPRALQAAQSARDRGYYVAGYVAYEAGYALDPSLHDLAPPRTATDGPLVWLGVYDAPHVWPAADAHAAWTTVAPEAPTNLQFAWPEADYRHAFRQVKQHIHDGNVYQINLTGPVDMDTPANPVALYAHLRARQPVPYGAYINTGARTVLSASLELFIRWTNRRIHTRPMKGTAARPPSAPEDNAAIAALRADAKTQAENLMIVDLLRNDLSICCTPGSVHVPELFAVERHPTVLQMTSTVEGQLREDVALPELFRALFPCGSVVGAPKLRAMQIIRSLEPAPRGVYCGAIGWAGPDDEAAFSVAIRTVEIGPEGARMGTGGGLVWDSEADAEYRECKLKAQFLADTEAPAPLVNPTLIETMRWDGEGIPLLDRHLHRLEASAQYFGIPCDTVAIRQALASTCNALPDAPHMVRGTLAPNGTWQATTRPLSAPPERPWRLTLSLVHVDPRDVRLHHKTTARTPYDEAAAFARAHDCDEALLQSHDGFITEGARSNVFIERNGQLYTPPRSSGLLGGVYRAKVIEERDVRIQPLTVDDLRTADTLYCCNAVRGWRTACWVEPEAVAA
ncbi:aminodeoxychorismate synthase, component I [Longimonas halophila]|uniref:Aminodeoxychorismate synthase, component I n=1 Tax=Longimonas halophila TaxID=1469170 RepID=A0A2H3NQG6_9BACT|nr:aminodeoxychorismate synthase component I [Longimonas halophila]PEN07913.1 aminodeoxychorismate synthase, component I [Longimonas halophila]